ncbi:hypothetical protein ACHAQF_009215 [Verticillium nonalfalfae]|uniref:Uncharacterized protein n=2 Tax=Verticillium dahliae TaxID=27337 RepID=G2X542_VERDV|nr:uncharacterized protein VDAG_05274 [Verticillium dahliae VdLs.17]KAF3344257.1 hypothetical protein VdG2_07586 [Verticillium dahliae VDG2]KAH6699488.1 hypothetical protein EV126DRAFT_43664 [Verticillium dahliae]EGY23836.1 hypothetical protein VDAG_05274 [Verticillium dahliae VdLs.17]PNH36324.1 hypothetical protein BJF96_g608 [Verticillium dahliae]PNH50275.1 hypothetical protein VD0003_g6895 [Verticillium dahliae]
MAILKHFRAKSPDVVVHDHEVICISDDDSNDGDDGNDGDDSNDECDFEDVEVDVMANVEYTEARFEEAADANDETTVDGVGRDARSQSGVTGGLPPEEEGALETEDEGIATDIAPHDDAAGGDWDPDDDEASRTESVDLDQDESNASGFPDGTCTSLRDIVVELGALRDRVAHLEAQQHVHSVCQAPSTSKTRHRTTSARPRAKRRKDSSIVNISATRAFVQ